MLNNYLCGEVFNYEEVYSSSTEEWMRLVKDAMNLNVSKEEFKQFLEEKSQNNTTAKNIK